MHMICHLVEDRRLETSGVKRRESFLSKYERNYNISCVPLAVICNVQCGSHHWKKWNERITNIICIFYYYKCRKWNVKLNKTKTTKLKMENENITYSFHISNGSDALIMAHANVVCSFWIVFSTVKIFSLFSVNNIEYHPYVHILLFITNRHYISTEKIIKIENQNKHEQQQQQQSHSQKRNA